MERLTGFGALLLLALLWGGCARMGRTSTIVLHAAARQVGPNHVQIELDRSFVERYANRATIQTRFTVDAVMQRINPPAFDGDLHFAGRSDDIQLRLVAEIKNARSVPHAVALVREAQSSRRPLEIIGGWRLWPEHAIGLPHVQGRPVDRLENANPDHVFEIHPIVQLDSTSLLETLRPVQGYRPYGARPTFASYERAELELQVGPSWVRLTTPAGLYNDVHFLMEIVDEDSVASSDARFLMGRALDLDGNLLVAAVRMVFLRDSPPEIAIRGVEPGTRIHAWGLPRISFAGLFALMAAAGTDTTAHQLKLPYELVIVGTYPEKR